MMGRTLSRDIGTKSSLGKRIWRARYVYLLLLPGLLYYLVFKYIPIFSIRAFQPGYS